MSAPSPMRRCKHCGEVECICSAVPSPYRFTVSVGEYKHVERWLVRLRRPGSVDTRAEYDYWSFTTEAEARSHAALVLAALHQATMEET